MDMYITYSTVYKQVKIKIPQGEKKKLLRNIRLKTRINEEMMIYSQRKVNSDAGEYMQTGITVCGLIMNDTDSFFLAGGLEIVDGWIDGAHSLSEQVSNSFTFTHDRGH